MAFYKFVLLAVIALGISFLIIFALNRGDISKVRLLGPPFSMVDNSLNVEPERALFEAVIENSGDTPLVVEGYGFIDQEGTPSAGCIFVSGVEIIVPPGESFNVQIECVNSPDNLDFYIVNLPQGASEPQLSGELGVILPNLPDLNNWINSYLNPTNSNPTGTFSNSGGTGTGGTGTGGPRLLPNLETPIFGEINTPLNDVTPTIYFSTEGSQCRMGLQDTHFWGMSVLNSCVVDIGDSVGNCTLANNFALSHGPNNLYISCISLTSYNTHLNNLDIPLIIDIQPPIISNVHPSYGTYPSSINGVTVYGAVSGASSCSAGVYNLPNVVLNPYNPLPLKLDNVLLDSGNKLLTAPLVLGDNYLTIICHDDNGNYVRVDSGNYFVSSSIIGPSSSKVIGSDNSVPSKSPIIKVPRRSSSQNNGASDVSKPPIDTPIDTPIDNPSGDVSGAVVENMTSSTNPNFMNIFINWFKRLFD